MVRFMKAMVQSHRWLYDNRDAAEMVASLLKRAGHFVRVANDPSEALSFAEDFRPQVAVLDIGLPVMDGYALAGELRARLPDAPPILIALTGYGQEEDKRRSKAAGFSLHLVKPVLADTLLRQIDAHVRGPSGSSDGAELAAPSL